jgi:hypothetical protein
MLTKITVAAWRRLYELRHDERGDVPGWVLITAMTCALVLVLWAAVLGPLRNLVTNAINNVQFGG